MIEAYAIMRSGLEAGHNSVLDLVRAQEPKGLPPCPSLVWVGSSKVKSISLSHEVEKAFGGEALGARGSRSEGE